MIFVFDFDYTLSDAHTYEKLQMYSEKKYISNDQLEIISTGLQKIKDNNKDNKLYILAKTVQRIFTNYLTNNYKNLYDIFGADNIICPTATELEGNERKGIEKTETIPQWARWKVSKLKEIHKKYPHSKIIFFDDGPININAVNAIVEETKLTDDPINITAYLVNNPKNIGSIIDTALKEITTETKSSEMSIPNVTRPRHTFDVQFDQCGGTSSRRARSNGIYLYNKIKNDYMHIKNNYNNILLRNISNA
jgi:hypothetical protein